jgi:hypothetical protein
VWRLDYVQKLKWMVYKHNIENSVQALSFREGFHNRSPLGIKQHHNWIGNSHENALISPFRAFFKCFIYEDLYLLFHIYDDIPLLVSFLDISMSFNHLFKLIVSIDDHF